VAPPVAARVTA
jgi:hypothetical protein